MSSHDKQAKEGELTSLYRDIASKDFTGGTDAKAQRPFPRFLVKLSELCPRLVHKQMVLLQKHLDSDVRVLNSSTGLLADNYLQSYLMRNAIIEVIGNLIREIANSEEEGEPGEEVAEKEPNGVDKDTGADELANALSKVALK